MFRLFRTRPNPYSLGARIRGSTSTTPGPQVIQVHRVKLRRKWFKPRNFVVAGLVYYLCFQVYKTSVFGTISEWLDEQDAQLTKKEREEMEEEMLEPIFIPLPFTTRGVASPPYRSTDPEWQAFVRINKNRDLTRRIQAGLAEISRKTAASSNYLKARCGADMRLGRYWLDIQYPYRPPPTFVRKGLTIGDDGVSITEEEIDAVTARWVYRSLWPTTLTMSLWTFSGALMKQNALNFARLLGYERDSTPNSPFQQTIEKATQKLKKPTTESDAKTPSSLPSADKQAADGSSTDPTSPVEKRAAESSSATRSPSSGAGSSAPIVPNTEPSKPKSARDIYGIRYTQEHTSGPWRKFKDDFWRTWHPIRDVPPRGAIFVSGLVEIQTPHSFIVLDVSAWWNPKTEKFDLKTANFVLRTIRAKTQTPLNSK
ncbi:hypothetical protein F5Y04DRAFT_28726 [Hypomontagnella monticulosa]|nr:hypothetical protein F5Y04DRAFT_28726 [Hypomontagnella monticulosa]